MLNRRILRIKVFKAIYAYAEDQSMTLKEAQKTFRDSCEATRDLYLFMLLLIPALSRPAREEAEAAMGKFNPTEEDLHPNMKFAESPLAALLSSDVDFAKIIEKKNFSWDQYDVLLRKLYARLREEPFYKDYMLKDSSSVSEDAALWTKFFEDDEAFSLNPELEAILQDISLMWTDDLPYALTWCCKTLKSLSSGNVWRLPPLWQSDILSEKNPDVDSDEKFALKLLDRSYAGWQRYVQMVADSVPKWDESRLYTTDLVLIAMGLAEAVSFPEIPVKVTITEYVEISKYYSTPKSRAFVNGLLDRLIQKLRDEGAVVKEGRGLL